MSESTDLMVHDGDGSKARTLDEYLADLVLYRTIGDVVKSRETSNNMKALYCATLVWNAVFGIDIGAIETIANRVDGTIPKDSERELFANIIGGAIEDVLGYDASDTLTIWPTDPCVIAIAKVIVTLSMCNPGNNVQLKKDRQKANDMILNRVGGRRTEPSKSLLVTEYAEPDWMSSLPEGPSTP